MTSISFNELGLNTKLVSAVTELGYESPTSIQEQSIPILNEGHDLLAQAQTGTGKTASFALPILNHLDIALQRPQALIITPTRELAIQVAEAFQQYAKKMKDFHVIPIYGGQSYQIQFRALKRGAHVIVGTPGRVMDHLRRKTISVDTLKTVVLDEADEMLNMGFIKDIEWILEQIPHKHQTVLFSATMPASIEKISKRYLKDAKSIHIKPTKSTVDTIDQYYTRVSNNQKMDVLTRFLEVEEIEAVLVFTRTINTSTEIAEKLLARGYAAAALNGDMKQSQREKVITQIKKGALDIIVATDVAARGIDVDRISYVINYDIPHDTESYIHRIGRTGRAGRKGTTILFVTPREHRLLNAIKKAVHTPINEIEPPSITKMKEARSKQFAEKIISVIEKSKKLAPYYDMVSDIIDQSGHNANDVAAALSYLMQQSNPIPSNEIEPANPTKENRSTNPFPRKRNASNRSNNKWKDGSRDHTDRPPRKKKSNNKNRKRKEKY